VRSMLGTIDDSFLYSILEGLARGDSGAVLAIAEDMRSRSVGLTARSRISARSCIASLSLSGARRRRRRGRVARAIGRSRRTLDPEEVQLYYQIAIHGRQDLPFAPDEFAGFTMRSCACSPFRRERATPANRSGTDRQEASP